jgi:3-isopropylmalate/(R)-2-methylmalate dehydratase small subunit
MQPFTRLTAIAAPMPKPNINTDDIYPGPMASSVGRKRPHEFMVRGKMGPNAFAALRWDDEMEPRPDFILNQPPYDRAQILVTGPNFGCGSSREMAVWCLEEIGIRCLIGSSFGDIFFNNCFKNGVLPIRLSPPEVETLLALAADPEKAEITVDLEAKTVIGADGKTRPFDIAEYYREMLLQGLNEISATRARLPRIEAFERGYHGERPWLPA